MLKVYKECCKNCLFSKDKIVSDKRKKFLLKDIIKNQSSFICHKASIDNKDIVCKSFYDNFGSYSQNIRIAKRLNAIEFVKHENNEKLISYTEMLKGD